MTDIVLNEITSGYNLSKINSNFDVIEEVVNEDILHLNGGNNTMRQQLDMNSYRIINLPAPVEPNDAARLQDVIDVDSGNALQFKVDLANEVDPSLGVAIVGRAVQTVTNIAELKLLKKDSPAKRARTLGYYAVGDGGDGTYYLDTTDFVSSDNGGTVHVAADGGRWKLIAQSRYDVKQFGAKADWNGSTGTNNTPFIQNCITLARLNRKDVYLSAGDYKIDTGVIIDNSASTSYIDPKKINFYGDGIHMSRLVFLGVTGAAISVLGGNTAGTLPMQCFQKLSDFGVLGTLAAGTYGVYLDTTQHITLDHMEMNSFDYGINMLDVDFASFRKCIIHWNNHGVIAQERTPRLVNSTRPNGLDFIGCQIGGNGIYGCLFLGGACVNFYGGDVEGNGLLNGTSGWGLRFESCGVQGGVGANLNGVYFEQNQGVGDVWIVALDPPGAGLNPYHCVHYVQSCSFNRVTSVNFTDHNVVASVVSANAGKQRVIVDGCSFKGYGTYVPNAGRTYVHYASDARNSYNCTIANCIMQDDVETVPQNDNYNVSLGLSGAQAISASTTTDIAWTLENYDADGMHVANATTISIPATGKYEITASVYWAANATGVRTSQIIRNGVTEIGGVTQNAATTGRVRQNFSREMLLTKGDTISIRVFQDTVGVLNVDSDGTSISIRAVPF